MKKIYRNLLPKRRRIPTAFPLQGSTDRAIEEVNESKAVAENGLEQLPTELKLALLSSLSDLSDLQSLVHASPSYHAVYLTDRHRILHRVIVNGVDPRSFQYVLALGRALDIRHGRDETKEEVLSFLEGLKTFDAEPASDSEAVFLRHGPTLGQIQRSIQFTMRDFCTAVFSTHPTTGEALKDAVALSPIEQARISRAFYRYQIFCIVFQEPADYQYIHFDAMEISFLFLNLFTPWEVEEIACVRTYLTRKYRGLYEKYADDLSESTDTVFPSDSCNSSQRFVEPNDVSLNNYVERCISLGIPYLQNISQVPPERQVEMLRHKILEMCSFITDALYETPYDYLSCNATLL